MSRSFCYRCAKPEVTCVCAQVPRVVHRTSVHVLQHPRERFHPIGTSRFVELGLSRGEVQVAYGDADAPLRVPPMMQPGTAVLFPSTRATDLTELEPAARPERLIVLDGTWRQARALHRANPWLDRLPHVVLSPTAPSNYRIRREPHESYLSTIESISLALRILEPDLEGLDEVLAAFDAMIDTQIQFRRARPGPKRRRHAQTYFGVPRAIAEAWERLVLGYVEATNAGEPVQVVLVRPADGSVLDVLSRCPLDETFVARTELSRKDLEAGVSLDAVRAAVQAFLRPTDRVHGWTPRDVARLEAAGVPRPRSLRSAYRSVRGRGRGHLGEVVSMEALSPERVPVRGRAGERLGNALAIARYLHLRGQGLVHEAAPERQGSGPSLERPNV